MGNTDMLVVRPSILNGIARTIDLFGGYSEYNISSTTDEADARSLYADWEQIQKDFAEVFKEYQATHKENVKK